MMESFGKKKLACKDLYGYLLTLSSEVLNGLYDHPFTCLAVFRGLPEIGKHYVMRTLFTDQAFPEHVILSWCKKEHRNDHKVAVDRLCGLQIWNRVTSPSVHFEMNKFFQQNLRIGVRGGGKIEEEPLKAVEERHARDVTYLDNYAKERWECILQYMTGSQQGMNNVGVSPDVAKVLISSGLLTLNESENNTSITSAGFQFLLLDTSSQVWYFMVQHLNSKDKAVLVQCLSFLFQTGFSVLGKDYPVKNLTAEQFNFLQLLREVGLAHQRKRTSKRYYPTRLAINLGTAVTGSTNTISQGQSYLVVETNYRVYAYTESALQVSLLSLFTDIKSRFPDFTVGTLSRESVQQALACGISASQIIDFLRTRARPQMLSRTPIIPPTITDQIKLWEMERDRLRYTEGVLYNQFLAQSDFEMLRRYADENQHLLWANSQKRLMVVSKEGHDDVKRYWKKNKPS
ncbi:general transcription factor IIH subunit 4-like [Clytia hemisphaerica]|uniref:General transcription factor IIH subunit 4 n=1 Tax=Clytia hemisphaerica TaxID=252671 RepID=A0A7M5X1W7_9CNID|eukprot:TCONS_00072738-protein